MRKLIYSALAAIGLLLSPSCSDENEIVNGSGNEALVSFTVNLADGIQTKAISDGTTAKKLYVKVFDKDLHYLPDISRTYDLTGKEATVTLDLVKGKTYNFLFWAQCEDEGWHSPYTISDVDGSITIDYDNAASNKEERDAFLATEKNFTVTGSFTKKVYLYRPFAQLNFLTTKKDIEDALKAHIIPENTRLQSSVTLSKVATKLYPFENTVGGELTDVTFAASAVPVTFDTNGKVSESSDQVRIKDRVTVKPSDDGYGSATPYYYLATNYFLIGNKENDRKLITATMKIDGADGKLEVNNIPVEWNYRTNIYGDLLTASNKFNVIIDSDYEDVDNNGSDDINSSVPSEVATPEAVAEAITNSSRNIIYTANIVASELVEITIPKVFNDTDDKDLALTFTGTIADDANITIKAATTGEGSAPKNVTIKTSNGIWTVELTESTVTFTGGSVQVINSSTSANTLIIASDMEVKQLINALAGGIKVLGTVGTNSESQSSGPVITIYSENATGNIEIQGTVNGNIQADNNATVTIQQGASVRGNVEAKNDIVVHGRVTGDLESDTKIQLSSEATVTGNLEAGIKEIAPGATTPSANISEYTINTADDLFAFAKQVNEKRNAYAGKTVVLADNIDLAGREWTPIGGVVSYPGVTFAGTFNGNNKIISNLTASDFTANHATAGFFGSITGTVKNLTLQNVNITSSHYAGGIVGYSSTNVGMEISNCKVIGGTITSTPELLGSSYDNGDKVGGIIGYMASGDVVKDCSVSNVTIQGHRDLGGICGAAGGTLENNRVDNITIIQSDNNKYKNDVSTVAAIVSDRVPTYTETGSSIGAVTFKLDQAGALQKIVKTSATSLAIELACDAAVNIKPWVNDGNEFLWGSMVTTAVSITGKTGSETLTFNNVNSDWNYVACANESAQINISNLKLTNSGNNDGPWNRHDIYFNNPVTLTDIFSDKAIAVRANATLEKVTIADKGNTDDYGLWIVALGQKVTVKDCKIDMVKEGANGRAIAIKDQYVSNPLSVTLSVSGTTFKSQKKAAVLVTSTAGADITWGAGNNISGVQADQINAVWNDADRTAAWDSVNVDGCTKYQEQ